MGKCAVLRVFIVLGSYCVASAAVSGEMYFTPAAVFTDDDKARAVDDAVAGGQVSLGWVLSDRVSIEGMLGSSDLGGPNDLTISEGSLNLLVSLSPDTRLSPYLIGGIGMMKTDFNVTESETPRWAMRDWALSTALVKARYH